MSYIAKKGKAAAESALAEKEDLSNALVSLKSGVSLKVRVASVEDFVEYFAASVYKVFYTTPVEPGNLYQKAAAVLYDEAKKAKDAGDDTKSEELRNQAYQIKPKPRYLLGFINLADGQPIVVDLSKAQAKVIIAAIEKNAKKLDRKPFELAKDGKSKSTVVSLTPLDADEESEDLTPTEKKTFEATKDAKVPDDLYEKVLSVKSIDDQAEDLEKFGFDVSRIGITGDKDFEAADRAVENPEDLF
jgi:hypothetical protein